VSVIAATDFSDPTGVITAQTEYVLRETSALHTDIERDILPVVLAEFGRVSAPTTLQASILGYEWLERASFRFYLTFGSARNAAVLQFFSAADALSYRRTWYELAAAPTMPATAGLLQHAFEDKGVDDPSDSVTLPSQICEWLDITYGQLAVITGVSRATFFNWRHPGANPRPNSLQRVQRLYALSSLLVKRFGAHGARTWLHCGDHPAWERLMAGDLMAVEHEIRSRLFTQPAAENKHNELALDEVSLDLPAANPGSRRVPRRAGRQPTRRRLEPSD
jgi:hypothetical protein